MYHSEETYKKIWALSVQIPHIDNKIMVNILFLRKNFFEMCIKIDFSIKYNGQEIHNNSGIYKYQ